MVEAFAKYALMIQEIRANHAKAVGKLELEMNQAYLEAYPPAIKNDIADLTMAAYQAAVQRRLDRSAATAKAKERYTALGIKVRELNEAHTAVLTCFYEVSRPLRLAVAKEWDAMLMTALERGEWVTWRSLEPEGDNSCYKLEKYTNLRRTGATGKWCTQITMSRDGKTTVGPLDMGYAENVDQLTSGTVHVYPAMTELTGMSDATKRAILMAMWPPSCTFKFIL